jgi:hypothetical protein
MHANMAFNKIYIFDNKFLEYNFHLIIMMSTKTMS